MKCTTAKKIATKAKTIASRTRTRPGQKQRYPATIWDQIVDDAYLMGKLSERIETGGSANPKALEADIRRHNRLATDLGQFLKDLSDHMNQSEQQHDGDNEEYICDDCRDDLQRQSQQHHSKLVH